MKTQRSVLGTTIQVLAILSVSFLLDSAIVWAGGPPVEVAKPIQFSDNSTGDPTSWLWDFDYDGMVPVTGSELQNPTFTFTEARTYQVYLEVCNFADCHFTVKDVVVTEANEVFSDGFETGDTSRWLIFDIP